MPINLYKTNYVSLREKYSNIPELADFIKNKIYEKNKTSDSFRKKIEDFCKSNKVQDIKWQVTKLLENNNKIGEERMNLVYDFAVSLGYKGERPRLIVIKIPVRTSVLGFFNEEFIKQNKSALNE